MVLLGASAGCDAGPLVKTMLWMLGASFQVHVTESFTCTTTVAGTKRNPVRLTAADVGGAPAVALKGTGGHPPGRRRRAPPMHAAHWHRNSWPRISPPAFTLV